MGLNRFIKSNRGQAMVELALILPVLLMLVLGIIEFGRISFSYLVITELAREGARYGVVGHTDTEIGNHIISHATMLDRGNLSIDISPEDTARGRGDGLTVTLDYSVDILAPFIGEIVSDPFPLVASCTMRVE